MAIAETRWLFKTTKLPFNRQNKVDTRRGFQGALERTSVRDMPREESNDIDDKFSRFKMARFEGIESFRSFNHSSKPLEANDPLDHTT
jgi:hypothetical protein